MRQALFERYGTLLLGASVVDPAPVRVLLVRVLLARVGHWSPWRALAVHYGRKTSLAIPRSADRLARAADPSLTVTSSAGIQPSTLQSQTLAGYARPTLETGTLDCVRALPFHHSQPRG